jgi:hypothetical protein
MEVGKVVPRINRVPFRDRLRQWFGLHPTVLVFGVLAGIVLLFFGWRLGSLNDFIFRPRAEVSDLTVTFWPNIVYVQQSLKQFGQLPLWRTPIFSGSPLDVDPQSGLWYLPNVIFLLIPATAGFNTLFILHALLGGAGMWFWARATGTSDAGAMLSSIAYALVPKAYAHLGFGHVGLYYAATYVPWVLWAAYRIGRGKWTFAGLFGLALGWQIIAHPQLAFYTGIVGGTYILGLLTSRIKRETWIANLKLPLMGGLLGAGLAFSVAAAQLLPLLRFASLSARAGLDFRGSAVSSLPARYLVGLILADFTGFMDYVIYAGVPVLVLAVMALKKRQAWFWWTFIGLALVYSLGVNTAFYATVFRVVPLLSWLRAPTRIWFVASAAFVLMSGWGLDFVLERVQRRRRDILILFMTALGLFAFALVLGFWINFGKPPDNLIWFGLITTLTAAAFVGLIKGLLSRELFRFAFISIIAIDFLVVDASLVDSQPMSKVLADNGLGTFLAGKMDEGPFRVYSPSYSLPREIAALYGLESADGADPLYLQSYDSFMMLASGVDRQRYGVTVPAMEGGGEIGRVNENATPDPDLLGLLNVRFVASEFVMRAEGLKPVGQFGSTYLYENVRWLPRAFIVGEADAVDRFESALAWLKSHEASEEAVIQGGDRLRSGQVKAKLMWVERSPNQLVLNADLDREGLLVLSEIWYPGWHVRIDGQPGKIWQVDGILRGVYLDAGVHRVTLTYMPPTLIMGFVTSTIGLVICLVLIIKTSSSIDSGSLEE